MMASTPSLCKKQDGIICSFLLRQDCSHQTTAIVNILLLLSANGRGMSAFACTTVNVQESLTHPAKADSINPVSTFGRCKCHH